MKKQIGDIVLTACVIYLAHHLIKNNSLHGFEKLN